MNPLNKFSGGLKLTAHKLISPINSPPLPQRLIYPLLQRADCSAKPVVKIGERVLKGQLIAQATDNLTVPIHAASSGIIEAIAPHNIPHAHQLESECIIIKTDGLDESVTLKPLANYKDYQPTDLRQHIHQAGIVGLGGAAFPTAIKLHTPEQAIHTLIINGAECEPYISCDVALMQTYAEEIIQGALILQYILNAPRCIIALENTQQNAYHALTNASQSHNLEIIQIPAIYPTGGEKQLIKVLTNVDIPAKALPSAYGFICQNIGTVYAVHQAITLGLPLIERIITITGSGIKNPQNLRVRIGTPIEDLIAFCSGYHVEVEKLIMGGSMMGLSLGSDDIPVIKASNCFLALTKNDKITAQQSCIRCGECEQVCPVSLLPQQLHWYSQSQQLDLCEDYQLFDCIECGCCDVVCPSHIPLVQQFRTAKIDIKIKQQQQDKALLAKKRFENRQARLAKAEQEKQLKAEKRQAAIDKMKAAAKKKRESANPSPNPLPKGEG